MQKGAPTYPNNTKVVVIVFLLEPPVRTHITTRTVPYNALVKHDTVIAILATSDSS